MAALLPDLPGLTLVRNGSYHRLLLGPGDQFRGLIYRKKCPRCRTSFSLLPNDVAPLHSYGLLLMTARVAASLQGVPLRSKAFYERHDLVPDEPIYDLTSWSDRLNERPLRPSHQLFARWDQKMVRRAHVWLQALMFACLFVRCKLKNLLAEGVLDLTKCPSALRPVAMAVGLTALLVPSELGCPLQRTLFLLSCSPSHKRFRAPGRPPPQYGGELNL